jgi:hypothetical protein
MHFGLFLAIRVIFERIVHRNQDRGVLQGFPAGDRIRKSETEPEMSLLSLIFQTINPCFSGRAGIRVRKTFLNIQPLLLKNA